MRQIGTLVNADHARRFAAFLVAERIGAQVEQDGDAWTIWVRNEDQLDAAKAALEEFRRSPDDPRYRDAESKAAQVQREEQKKAAAARKNVKDMRGQWKRGGAFQRAPLTCVLIGLCIFVFFLMQSGPGNVTPAQRWLSFSEVRPMASPNFVSRPIDGYEQIREGQIWRLVTPIFLHFGWMHILFNMMMLYSLGTLIEQRYGAWRMGVLILMAAVLSNVAQYAFEGNPLFGGMSGVVYALFGFAWMKTLYDPQSGIRIDQQTITILLVWLFVCMAAAVPPLNQYLGEYLRVANTAHFVGLVVGMAAAGATLALRRSS